MPGRVALSVSFALLLLAAPAAAENRDDFAPFRFRTPPEDLGAVERERAIIYRNQLQRQQRDLDRDAERGRLDPVERRRLFENQTELDRMNEVVRTPAPSTLRLPSSRSLPSVAPPVIPRSAP
jgi:hypothetical protein